MLLLNMVKYGYIYIHKNKENGHVYVGQSTQTPERRFRKGAKALNAYKTCPAMYAALVKYGWAGFDTEIIAWADSQEELNKLEEKYISEYQSADGRNGYNTVKFSEGRGKQSENTKEKIRQKQLEASKRRKDAGIVVIPHNKLEYKVIDGQTYKHCNGNGTPHWDLIEKFGKYKRTKDKLHWKCKKCQREYKHQHKYVCLSDEEWKLSYKNRQKKKGLDSPS